MDKARFCECLKFRFRASVNLNWIWIVEKANNFRIFHAIFRLCLLKADNDFVRQNGFYSSHYNMYLYTEIGLKQTIKKVSSKQSNIYK